MSAQNSVNARSTDRINILNIWLMLASALLAFIWPYYLFLIAYAVLGPLHYLTEISWLHDRSYYTRRKYDYLILLGIGVVYGSSLIIKFGEKQVLANIILLAFVGSVILSFTTARAWRIGLLIAGAVAVYLIPLTFASVITGLLLLTLIHVFIFTGFFITAGAMRSNSTSGYVSLAVFVGLALLLFLFQPLPGGGVADAFVVSHYDKAFGDLNIWMMRVFGLSQRGAYASDPFEFSPGAIAVMRFISFAYLYHYLNWFSKTKVIGWHEVSKQRLAGVVGLWLAAIVVYLIDYDLGLKVLFFLSALHVLLEFPLDLKTIGGLGAQVRSRIGARLVGAN
jgi:hypothetical protein